MNIQIHLYTGVCVCVCVKGVHVHMYIYTHNYSVADLRTGSTEPSLYEVAYLILTPSLICKTIPTSKTTEAVLHCSNNSSKARFIWKECANCELQLLPVCIPQGLESPHCPALQGGTISRAQPGIQKCLYSFQAQTLTSYQLSLRNCATESTKSFYQLSF